MSVMAYAPYGAGGVIILVEADIRRGIPGTDITGLAEGVVRKLGNVFGRCSEIPGSVFRWTGS
jgi:hypothetical protein